MRYIINPVISILMVLWAASPVMSASIPIENASFEFPEVDPNAFPAVPIVDGWTEIDLDTLMSTNTGVFANTAEDSPDHIVNADGRQLAFLGSQAGNALEQDLDATYKVGCEYQLTLAVGVSMLFPPSSEEPIDTIELVLYYREENEPVDIVSRTVDAMGFSQVLQDFSVHLPAVNSEDDWAGKTIGIAIRATGTAGGFWDLDNVRLIEIQPVLVPIENASFESPAVDPNAFPAVTIVDGWTEIDLDILMSTNTGVFANTAEDSPDHIVNAEGRQLAFLGSQAGNALEQDLNATYKVGCEYKLTAAVGVSMLFPPSSEEPVDTIELVLYYREENEPVDIVSRTVDAMGFSQVLQDFSVYLPAVNSEDVWAGKTIGIAIRATGTAVGFWDLDNVRLIELPSLTGTGIDD
jgi:hypothetical protein